MSFLRISTLIAISIMSVVHAADDHFRPKYDRIIVDDQDYTYPPPVPLIDPNHQGMINMPFYNEADATKLDNDAALELLATYGIDFRPTSNPSIIVDPNTGVRILPGVAQWFPYIAVDLAYMQFDSSNKKRGTKEKWVNNKVGVQVLFTADGVAPGGTLAGTSIKAGDFFPFGEFNYLKVGENPMKKGNREVVKFRCSNLNKQTSNQVGRPQIIITLDLFDSKNRKGKYLGVTEVYTLDGVLYLRENPVSSWVYENGPDADDIDNS